MTSTRKRNVIILLSTKSTTLTKLTAQRQVRNGKKRDSIIINCSKSHYIDKVVLLRQSTTKNDFILTHCNLSGHLFNATGPVVGVVTCRPAGSDCVFMKKDKRVSHPIALRSNRESGQEIGCRFCLPLAVVRVRVYHHSCPKISLTLPHIFLPSDIITSTYYSQTLSTC